MRNILTLVRKDFALFFRNRAAVGLTFFVPIALIFIFGQVFGINRKDPGPTGVKLAVVNESDNPAANKLVAALEAEKTFRIITTTGEPDHPRPLTANDLQPLMHENQFRYAVVIPRDLIPASGFGVRLHVLSNPINEMESQMVNGILQKTILSNVPELLGQSLQASARDRLGDERYGQFTGAIAEAVSRNFGGDPAAIQRQIESGSLALRPDAADSASSAGAPAASPDLFSRIVQIDREQVVGKQVKSPAATRLVGGWAMMFLLFALSASAAAAFDEKRAGLYQRLLSAPVTRSHILWAKFLYGVILGLVQLTALFFAGRLLYGIDVFSHLGNLVIICLCAAAACTAFGMLITSLVSTAESARGLATFLVLTMSACGGAWFPVSLMPEVMQEVARFTLVYWAIEGFNQVLWAGYSLRELLPTIGILLGIAAGVMAIALWRFHRSRLIE